jgi:hypothetical protein
MNKSWEVSSQVRSLPEVKRPLFVQGVVEAAMSKIMNGLSRDHES